MKLLRTQKQVRIAAWIFWALIGVNGLAVILFTLWPGYPKVWLALSSFSNLAAAMVGRLLPREVRATLQANNLN